MKKLLLLTAGIFAALSLQAVTANPYAYNISAEGITDGQVNSLELKVNYTLNAPATKVAIVFYNGETVAKTVDLTDSDLLTAGAHSTTVSLDNMEQGVEFNWSVVATGEQLETATELGTNYTFWAPYGIAVDNNPESDHFGRILVTEAQMNMSSSYWTNSEGVLAGIYEFDPQMQRVANASGTYGYNGGLTFVHYKYPSGYNMFAVKKVRISDDGRIFVGNLDCLRNPMYEVDPDNLANWTPIFQGTMAADTSGVVTDADGNTVAIASASFDVVGSGENLKIVNHSCRGGQVYNPTYYSTDIYNLGTATSWATAPSENVTTLTKKYTQSSSGANVAFDKDGEGIWYVQYRGTPSEAQPAIKHTYKSSDGTWVEDYSDVTTVARGGGVHFNKDYSLLAIPTAAFNVGIYDMAEVENAMKANRVQAPSTLTPKYTVTTSAVRGFNDFAFDYADNLYTCDNGKEKFVQIALPRTNLDCEVPAKSAYKFAIAEGTGVVENVADAEVVKVEYVNVNGQVSDQPFTGINVVVKHMSDGSKQVTKVLK